MPETLNLTNSTPGEPLTLEMIKGVLVKEVLARPKLSIGDVAAMLGVGPRTLSAVLKREGCGNFCSFVSDLRLAEAARLLRLHRYARFFGRADRAYGGLCLAPVVLSAFQRKIWLYADRIS